MANIEIERKFLVNNDSYKQAATMRVHIVQGYICKEQGRTVRVRVRTDAEGKVSAFLTIKSEPNANGFAHFEWETAIREQDARQLLHLCLPGLIEKTRWIVPYEEDGVVQDGLKWEIDEFHGRHAGLVLAELELEREDQPYRKAAFIGEEVTGQSQYYNANM